MAKNRLITGLDIGSSEIKLLVVRQKKENSNPEVIFSAQEPSSGVRRGVVINVEKVSEIIRGLISRAESEIGQRIKSVYINIGGTHIASNFSRGMVAVSKADRTISKEDVERALEEAAKSLSLPSNNEILEALPKEFIIDGVGGIKIAEGLQGKRLETEILILSNFVPYKNNLTQAVLESDLKILDIVPSGLSSALAILSPRQKELGVALVDIGGGTSSLAVFEEGNLIHLAVLPMGSVNITNDIAIGLKTEVDTAEFVKIKLGCCVLKGKNKKEKIEIEGEEPLIFSQKTLIRIIEARASEIFGEVRKELKKIGKLGLLPAGIIFTGGGAKLPHMLELAKKELKLPCKIGRPANFSGLEDDPGLSTVCGLVLRGLDLEGGKGGQGTGVSFGIKNKIKNFFKIFIP